MTEHRVDQKAQEFMARHGAEASVRAGALAETLLAAGHFYIGQWEFWRAVERRIGADGDTLPAPAGPAYIEAGLFDQAIREALADPGAV